MDPLELEARKLELAAKELEATIELRKAELELRRAELAKSATTTAPPTAPKTSSWNTAPGLAVIGGVVTLLAAVFGNLVQGCNNTAAHREEERAQLALERQKFQSALIQKAIERAENTKSAAINLNFLWEAGLISDYDKIPSVLKKAEQQEDTSFSLPSRQTYGGIVGPDDRIQIQETSQFPYSAICKLTITGSNGGKFLSTGFVVAPRVIITGAYSLYMHDGALGEQGFVESVTVAPGQKGETLPFGEIVSTEFKVTGEWKDRGQLDKAIGAIILPEPLKGTGAFKLQALTDETLLGGSVRILGYPADRSRGRELWESTGHITDVSMTGLNHDLDTAGGTGGAPVLYESSGQTYIVGIHVGSMPQGRAIRLDQTAVELIQRWISESP